MFRLTSYTAGETIIVTVDNGLGGLQEWVALYVASNPDSSLSFESKWQYLNGTKTQPSTAPTYPVTLSFTAPTTAGTYNIRWCTRYQRIIPARVNPVK